MTPFAENTPGIFLDVPADVYRRAPGCSHSMLKNIEPPARLPDYLTRPRKQTAAQLFGSIVHHLVLTPKLDPFWAVPPCDLRTTEGKKWKAENNTKTPVDAEVFEKAQAAAAAVLANDDASELLKEATTEVSVFCYTTNLVNPVLVKSRMDIVPADPLVIADLKTCGCADEESFAKDIESNGYHTQGAWYLDIWNAVARDNRTTFKLIAVEKEPPFLVAVWTVDDVDIQQGRERNSLRLQTYSLCSKAGVWPGHPSGKTICRPEWARAAQKREDRRLVERAIAEAA